MDKMFSLVTLFFCLWGMAPWLGVVLLIRVSSHTKFLRALAGLSLMVGGAGIVGLVDVMYLHPDAQGALVFIFIPLYQLACLILLTPFIFYFTKKEK